MRKSEKVLSSTFENVPKKSEDKPEHGMLPRSKLKEGSVVRGRQDNKRGMRHCDGASLSYGATHPCGDELLLRTGEKRRNLRCYGGSVMGLFGSELLERASFPRVAHRRNITFTGDRLRIISIDIMGLVHVFRNIFQCESIRIVDATEKVAIKSANDHYFCTLPKVNLATTRVKHPKISIAELDAVTVVNGPFIENGQSQIDFLFRGLRFKDRFDIMERESELIVEFFYVGV